MRNKTIISNKLDKIESYLSKLNYTIGTLDRDSSYKNLDGIKALVIDINSLLNREVQE
jgi:hypothetical protein